MPPPKRPRPTPTSAAPGKKSYKGYKKKKSSYVALPPAPSLEDYSDSEVKKADKLLLQDVDKILETTCHSSPNESEIKRSGVVDTASVSLDNDHPMTTRSKEIVEEEAFKEDAEDRSIAARLMESSSSGPPPKESFFTLTQKEPLNEETLKGGSVFVRSEKDQERIKKLLEKKSKLLLKKNRRKYKGLRAAKARTGSDGNAAAAKEVRASKYSKADVVGGVKMVLKENGEIVRIPVKPTVTAPAMAQGSMPTPVVKAASPRKPATVPKDEQAILLDLFFSHLEEDQETMAAKEASDSSTRPSTSKAVTTGLSSSAGVASVSGNKQKTPNQEEEEDDGNDGFGKVVFDFDDEMF